MKSLTRCSDTFTITHGCCNFTSCSMSDRKPAQSSLKAGFCTKTASCPSIGPMGCQQHTHSTDTTRNPTTPRSTRKGGIAKSTKASKGVVWLLSCPSKAMTEMISLILQFHPIHCRAFCSCFLELLDVSPFSSPPARISQQHLVDLPHRPEHDT